LLQRKKHFQEIDAKKSHRECTLVAPARGVNQFGIEHGRASLRRLPAGVRAFFSISYN
jgi:hypothetical protein